MSSDLAQATAERAEVLAAKGAMEAAHAAALERVSSDLAKVTAERAESAAAAADAEARAAAAAAALSDAESKIASMSGAPERFP